MSGFAPVPETPTAASRPLQTPHKSASLRTPLKTPGEQTSQTPIINFEAIEAQKENVQSLLKGRSAYALNIALTQRQATLKAQRKEFEDLVSSRENAESDDPLEAWTRYIKWCVDSFPSGQSNESELLLVLERCTRLFKDSPQYQHDSRYLRHWILYAQSVDSPCDVYNFLLANEIGTRLASLYEEVALVYERLGSFDKADETFRMGVHRSAHPLDRLKRRYTEFQRRLIASEGHNADGQGAYRVSLKQAMGKAQRAMLGIKTGSTSMSANSVRTFGVNGGLERVSATVANNGAKLSVFKDKDGEDAAPRRVVKGGWTEIPAAQKKEMVKEGNHRKGEVLPQRDNVTPKKPTIAVYRDSDEEDEDVAVKAKSGDVFTAASKEPSEIDRLKRNPLLHHEQESKLKPVPTRKPKAVVSSNSKPKPVSSASSSSTLSAKRENHALPLNLLYPGLKMEDVGSRRSRNGKSGEISVEELLAGKRQYSSEEDLWSDLDRCEGKWLPEIKKAKMTMKRDPTVTAFMKEAQDEVMQMFNAGMAESDSESSDEQSESEDEDEDGVPAPLQMLKENAAVPPTPTPAPKGRVPLGQSTALATSALATPTRKPLGERKHNPAPQRLAVQSEEEEEDSDEEIDYLNPPLREHAPLSPITEATECTRFTLAMRTPGAPSSHHSSTHHTTSSQLIPSSRGEDADNGFVQSSQSHQRDLDDSVTDSASESGGCPLTWAGSQLGDKDRQSKRMPTGYTNESAEGSVEDRFNASLVLVDDEAPKQCCPFDSEIIEAILTNLSLSVESSADFVDCRHLRSDKLDNLQREAQAAHRRSSSNSTVNLTNTRMSDCVLEISQHSFPVLQKLGEGAYGAVFLAEDDDTMARSKRVVGGINGDASFVNVDEQDEDFYETSDDEEDEKKLIAIKVETPPNRWEFYILGRLRARLSPSQLSSIICARKFFCFQDESFLLLEYQEKGTLLEIVNNAVSAGVASSSAIGVSSGGPVGIDEILAMFFIVEIIKIVESLHSANLLHGDLKIDNCLLRLDEPKETWTNSYSRQGGNGWGAKGVTLIDFGRAVDLKHFKPEQRFVADWKAEAQECIELQQGRSWRHEIDYHGIASIAYCLLFGKYIEVTQAEEGVQIDKPLRRYWQVELWSSLFRLCLNSGRLAQEKLEVAEELSSIRSRMESWLEENCFRAGKNLKGSLKKLEIWSIKRSG